ncbi:MAG: hypothetical protein AAB538_03670 [Patescibacteria group bacterium]
MSERTQQDHQIDVQVTVIEIQVALLKMRLAGLDKHLSHAEVATEIQQLEHHKAQLRAIQKNSEALDALPALGVTQREKDQLQALSYKLEREIQMLPVSPKGPEAPCDAPTTGLGIVIEMPPAETAWTSPCSTAKPTRKVAALAPPSADEDGEEGPLTPEAPMNDEAVRRFYSHDSTAMGRLLRDEHQAMIDEDPIDAN